MKAVLTYHSIDESGSPVSVSAEAFERHVRWLASGAVRVVPLPELLASPEDEDAVAITFDDAIDSFGAVAAPRLSEAGLPATVFVVSDRVGETNHWGHASDTLVPRMDLLGWEQLRAIAAAGFELGAHTRTHPDLRRLDGAALRDELEGCSHRIETETGQRPRTFAYPFGFHDPESVEAARSLFDFSCTARLGLVTADTDPARIPRLDMVYFRGPGRLEEWGSARFRRYLWVRQTGRRVRAIGRSAGRR